jgi:hypothetical protein
MPEFNLDVIKKEIEERKATQIVTEQSTGTGRMGAARDSKKFLIGLLQSVNQGAPTPEVQALRTVTEMSDAKYGVPTTVGRPAPQVQPYAPTPQQQSYQPQALNENFGVPPQDLRGDESYFDQQMQRGMELLRQRSNQNANPNVGLSQALNEYSTAPFVNQPTQGGAINAGALNEHINKTLNEMTNNSNFIRLVEAAYKNMINEMYAKEKIETALVEIVQSDTFKKLMKKTIVDTLIEIQNRNKSKV